MPTVLARDIINRVSTLLQNQTKVRWPEAELLDWCNDGQREVVLHKPNACVINKDLALVVGAKQSLPDNGIQLVDIPRNTNGAAIRVVSREVLDAQVPDWAALNRTSTKILHFCYTDVDPKHFYVYPPAIAGTSVEIIYNASPANATLDGVTSIDDIYASALVDYICYRAYSKDTAYTANIGIAQAHYAAFLAAIKGKAQAEMASDPNVLAKGNPNVIR